MFSEERARWKKFFDVFKNHFGEEVGFIPSVFESSDFDIDFIVGEESGSLFGIQILQFFPDEELKEDETEEEEQDEENGDDDGDDDDEATGYVVEYIFIKTNKKVKDIKEKKQATLDFKMETEAEEQSIHLEFYGDEEQFNALLVQIEEQEPEVFLEHPDFDF
ncbi:MAG: hypothetical protein JW776_01190 [Candidatus Lokiarchaeota archaeon]|nr:hypothetical protein [Candidatus Lokiarchaeota archaeon]